VKTLKGIAILALALALALALLTVSSVFPASATYPPNAVYFEPEHIEGGAKCNYSYTNIMVNTSVWTGGISMDIYFDPECVNITDVDFTGSSYPPLPFPPLWTHWGDHVRIGGIGDAGPGTHFFANLTLHCETENGSICTSELGITNAELIDPDANRIPGVKWYNATYSCGITREPDLVIEKNVTFDNGTFIADYTVTNIGDAQAGAVNNSICKLVNGELMECQPCPALEPGESYNGSFEPEICPCDTTLNVTVCVDYYDLVEESNETNNCLTNIWMCGDVNCNEVVDISDVIDLLYYVGYPGQYRICNQWAADVNCDKRIDMSDVIELLYYSNKLNCCCEQE